MKLERCDDAETCFGAAESPQEVGFAGSPYDGAVELDNLCIEHVGGVRDAAVLGGEPGEATAESGTANANGRGACADDWKNISKSDRLGKGWGKLRTSIVRCDLLHLLVILAPRRARTECDNLVLIIPFELVKRSETDQDIFGGSIAVAL